MVPESENEKDRKRALMVLSKGHEVVGLGYSRLSRDAASVADRGEESGNPNRVDRVHWEYDMDR
jgi:predicted RNA-binding protein with PUA domain